MSFPQPGDYINIHSHGASPEEGIFTIENLMAHEDISPIKQKGISYSYGIHPWFLNVDNYQSLINSVREVADNPDLLAIGEAGFDKIRGPSPELQANAFEEQVLIAERVCKPVFIHCVRAWDELLASQKKLKPQMPWMVHGFRGSVNLAEQLISKGMYLSFWFDFVIRPESANLLRSIPREKIFLETDGSDVDIREIYRKVANDLNIPVEKLKTIITSNFNDFFEV